MKTHIRFWDRENNQYSEEPFFRLTVAKDGKIYNSENDEWTDWGVRYIPEFSIGLKADNGEIFNGDIVEVCVFMISPQNPDDDHHFRGKIFFENACYQLIIYKQMSKHTDGKWIDLDWRCGLDRDLISEEKTITIPLFQLVHISGNLGEYNPENVKIVGNIHKHKKLLK